MHQAAEYQQRRAEQKRQEQARRAELLKKESVDVTPKNGDSYPWTVDGKFDQEWSMKPVKIKGVFDHEQEKQVAKVQNGEKGV